MLHGHDISAYQGNTAPAVDFVIVKATGGKSYTSSRFAAQWASAKSRARHRGAYHFARPEESSATSQAARFLSVVKPAPGESVWLDLEASDLNQAKTNAWAKAWGDYIREQAPGVTSGVYLGSGYASNGTGRDLNQHFDYWWYPQYPNVYQLVDDLDIELHLAQKRSSLHPERMPIAASAKSWPPAVTPWLPGGLTVGWPKPHIWQFTDNFGGLDANITNLTIDQLAGGGGGQQPTPQEEDEEMASTGVLQARANVPNGRSELTLSIKNGTSDQLGIWGDPTYDNPDAGYPKCGPGQFRVIAHVKSRTGVVLKDPNKDSPTYNTEVITVGFEADGKGWCDKAVVKMPAGKNADAWKVYRLDNEPCQFGADISHS